MKIQNQKVSKKLKNLREQKKLTQEQLAKDLGVSRQSIIALEQGRCLPSLPLAIHFSEIFDLPFEAIFTEAEIMHHNFREEVNKIMANDLSPWSPMREVTSLHEAIDRLFEENWPMTSSNKTTSLIPKVDVFEKGSNIIVKADLPGIKEEDLSIEVGDEMVTISGERKNESETKDKNYFRKEVNIGSFSRTVPLPSRVNKEKAEAEIKNGILTVSLNKKAKTLPKVTKIKIKKG